jgi:hypothetical protein
MKQVVIDFSPVATDERAAEVVAHGRRHRRKKHQIDAAFVHQLQLSLFERRPYLVVADGHGAFRRLAHLRDLEGAEDSQAGGNGRVVSVGVDQHASILVLRVSCFVLGGMNATHFSSGLRFASRKNARSSSKTVAS